MFRKSVVVALVLLSLVLLIGSANADLDPNDQPITDPTRIFIQSEGELTFTVQMTKGNVQVWPPGQEPPLSISYCETDGFQLEINPLWQKFSVDYVQVSSSTGCLSYWKDGDWEKIDNGVFLSFAEVEGVCFASCVPDGDDDDDDDDDMLVIDSVVSAHACLTCDPDPAASIYAVSNDCVEDFWTFQFNIESCDTVCSLDVTFTLDCEIVDETEYGIWELISGDCTGCTWEFLGGEFTKSDTCPPECTLSWVLEKPEGYTDTGGYFCDLLSRTFGIGPKPPSYIVPDPGDNQGEISGDLGDWVISLVPCSEDLGPVMASFDITTKPDDGLTGSDDVFYFTLEFENPENICSIDLYLYLADCSVEKSVWEFLDGIWEKLEGGFEWEAADTLPWRVNGTDYYCRLHLFYPANEEEIGVPIGNDDDDSVFGVGPDDYFTPGEPGGDDPDEPGEPGDDEPKSSGGGGCNVGTSASAILIAIPLLMVLFRKR